MTRAHRVLAGLLFAATLAGVLPASAAAEPVSAADTRAVRVGVALFMIIYLCLFATEGGAFIYFQF